MTTPASDTVLKRMAEAGRGHGGGAPPTPARAIGHAVAKAAQDLIGLPLDVIGAVELRASLAELPEHLPDRALLGVMDGPGGTLGLMVLSQETLASLIEAQTTGRLGPAEVAPRRPTRTDAAMSMRFLDRVMEELELILAADAAITWAGGFRYGRFLEGPRPLALLLEDIGYRILRLTLGFGAEAARQGSLLFAVPAEGRGRAPGPAPGEVRAARDAASAPGAPEWANRMERAVLGVPARVEAVLDRISLPLAAVMALKPGALLRLAPGTLARVRLEGHGRRLVATGQLGQAQGNLAVRLDPPPHRAAPELAPTQPGTFAAVAPLRPASAGEGARPVAAPLVAAEAGDGGRATATEAGRA